MNTQILEGGCLCGFIRYKAGGTPYDITHCHCVDCRRSSGAPFVTWATFRRESFRLTEGQPREVKWAGRVRGFCPQCGTQLIFLSNPEADEIDVTVCSLEHPEALLPADHIWIEDKLPWIRPADGLPEYTQKREIAKPK
jgi:hypothetical protein